jgi:hypothetical protein
MSPERQQQLISEASELVMRVREVDPERNGTWLESIKGDWRDLLIVLAAMVDPSVPFPVALGWTFPLAEEET